MRTIRKVFGALATAGALAGALTFGAPTAAGAATPGGAAPLRQAPLGWMCSVPYGLTWNWATYDPDCGGPSGGLGVSYQVIVPENGVQACSVPDGWAYTQIVSTPLCSPSGGSSYAYKLIRA